MSYRIEIVDFWTPVSFIGAVNVCQSIQHYKTSESWSRQRYSSPIIDPSELGR